MKILVATKKGQGQRGNDFCHAMGGEMVTYGMECDGGQVDDACGCYRSMVGVKTHKATTTVAVTETPATVLFLACELEKSNQGAGFNSELFTPEDYIQAIRALSNVASHFPLGTVLERRGGKFKVRKVRA